MAGDGSDNDVKIPAVLLFSEEGRILKNAIAAMEDLNQRLTVRLASKATGKPAKEEALTAGQADVPSTTQEKSESTESVSEEESPPPSDDIKIQLSEESKEVHGSNTEQIEASQGMESHQKAEDGKESTTSENSDLPNSETPQNPAVVSVGQDEVFCAATGKPCAIPNQTHEPSVDSAILAETSNSDSSNSETSTLSENTDVDSGGETNSEAIQSSKNTDAELKNEPSADVAENTSDENVLDAASKRT